MTTLYIIRHGHHVPEEGLMFGPAGDKGLTPLGIIQAERLRDRLAATGEIRADVLIASSLPRAKQTAEIIAPALGLPVILDDDLHELRSGPAVHGLTVSEAEAKFTPPDFEHEPLCPYFPGGENWGQFMLRVGMALDRITRQYSGKTIVLVAHGGIVDGSIIYFSRLSSLYLPPCAFHTHNTAITEWQLHEFPNQSGPLWTLFKYNDDLHIRDIGTTSRLNWAAIAPQSVEERPI